jgi:hypothetical protein
MPRRGHGVMKVGMEARGHIGARKLVKVSKFGGRRRCVDE